jgi:FkbH-like protein
MFETTMYERSRHGAVPAQPVAPYQPFADVARMSFLVWGEHCIECAAPSCYRTCDLYDRRPDGRCRRFAYGIFRNKNFPCLRGYGAEVLFKKWGKLEARGNTRLESVRAVLTKEALVPLLYRVAGGVGRMAARLTRDGRWEYAAHAFLERLARRSHRRHQEAAPDAFLLEVYNPGAEACRLQLAMSVAKPEPPRRVAPFLSALTVQPGYNRFEVSREEFRHVTECGVPFDAALIPEGDTSVRLVFLTADFVVYSRRPTPPPAAPKIKCVIWDLDHTLWKGTLLEGDDILVAPGVADSLATLDRRGILHSIASKNDHQHAWETLRRLGLADYFVYPRINWAPKSQNIERIAKDLNLGLDAFAFVDDNPFELAEVSRALPQVTCIPADRLGTLAADPRFAGEQSGDARQRRLFYQNAMVRDEKKAEFGDDYLGFLASCQLVLEVVPFGPPDAERVTDLAQRTNQLNFSGTKYTRPEVDALLARPGLEKYVLRCSDRYGSYGTVGFSVVRRDAAEARVEEFMLSCRVQGKFVEQAFFQFLVETHGPVPVRLLSVRFRPTARNAPARQVLEILGFTPEDSGDSMRLNLMERSLAGGVVTVKAASVPIAD